MAFPTAIDLVGRCRQCGWITHAMPGKFCGGCGGEVKWRTMDFLEELWRTDEGGRSIAFSDLAQKLRDAVTDSICGPSPGNVKAKIVAVLNAELFQAAVDDWKP